MPTQDIALSSSDLALDSLTSGVLALDQTSRVIFMNAALAKRLKVDRLHCQGRQAADLFASLTVGIPVQRTPLYRAVSLLDSSRIQSREVQCMDGEQIVHLREDSSPLRDPSGRLMGRLFAYHDLSWEKTVDRMKSDFISIASHELRTPMTSIKGGIDLVLNGRNGPISEAAADLLGVAHTACDRMIRLINDLLDLSKIEAGQIGLRLESIDLRCVAERVLHSLRPLAAGDNIQLSLVVPEDLPMISADADRMEQVITNLVSNAIKFSPVASEITVGISSDHKGVCCSVSDQGSGIKEEDLDRIFGKFQQASMPLRGASTGLGLAITRALVMEHGGKIWAESSGQGSRFLFWLPVTGPSPRLEAN